MDHIRVDPSNTNNKWVGFGLANVDTFIIRVGFELLNVDTIHTLTRQEHDPLKRIATPSLPDMKDYFLIIFIFYQSKNLRRHSSKRAR